MQNGRWAFVRIVARRAFLFRWNKKTSVPTKRTKASFVLPPFFNSPSLGNSLQVRRITLIPWQYNGCNRQRLLWISPCSSKMYSKSYSSPLSATGNSLSGINGFLLLLFTAILLLEISYHYRGKKSTVILHFILAILHKRLDESPIF